MPQAPVTAALARTVLPADNADRQPQGFTPAVAVTVTGAHRRPQARQSAPACRNGSLARSRPVVLVVFVLVADVVEGILVFVLGIRVVVVGAPRFRADAQLTPQPVRVEAAAVVLQLASNLNLLGLSSAAPHWLDPLERPEPCGPAMPLSLACVRTPVTHTEPP